MAVDEFSRSVEMGLRLSKRIYYGKDKTAPKPEKMEKTLSLSSSPSSTSLKLQPDHHPTAPMVYAVITEPWLVDNPEMRSYQPFVYGICNPPALIPLHMHEIAMEVSCYLDTAFVTVSGTWFVHCLTSGACCDCRIAIPMGEQGSVLGVEVESTSKSYFTQLITPEDEHYAEKVAEAKDGFLMKGNTYTLKVSEVEGGSKICVNARWSQKLLYQGDEFCVSVPFSFPAYVVPVVKRTPNREKVLLNVNSGTETVIICNDTSHPLKELRRQVGELAFSYVAEVLKWSTQDFCFTYSVCSNDIFGGVLLQTPSPHDYDRREMFCFYLFPGSNNSMKPFRKEVVFVVDISSSMRDDPLENTKDALLAALSMLNSGDSFNIIAFNGNSKLFSSSLEPVTEEVIANASEWVCTNFIAEGGTNLLLPLKQAIDMVGKSGDSIPLIFLITDGAVEEEREICNMMKGRLMDSGLNSPRIFTFGIGSYCNHYFLQMLATIGRGYNDAAYDVDAISDRLKRMFDNGLSLILANVTLDGLENLESHEFYPFRLPHLMSGSPLVVSGRYRGNFPDLVKARGFSADLSTSVIDIKVRKAKDMPIDQVCARREIDTLTAFAWLDQSRQQKEKVAKMSIQRGVPSEYTRLVLVQNDKAKPAPDSILPEEKYSKLKGQKIIYLRNPNVGFGDLNATSLNIPPGAEEVKSNEPPGMVMQAASSCWKTFLDRFCCMCFIRTCSQLNDQCAIACTQLCAALACVECLQCCCDMCDSCNDLLQC